MSRAFSFLRRKVERTLRIEVGVTGASEELEVDPQSLGMVEPLLGTQPVPFPEIVVERQIERVPAGVRALFHRVPPL